MDGFSSYFGAFNKLSETERYWLERINEGSLHDFEDTAMFYRYPEMFKVLKFEPERYTICPECGSELRAMYGCGWDNDLIFCSKVSCGYEIQFESSTEVEI